MRAGEAAGTRGRDCGVWVSALLLSVRSSHTAARTQGKHSCFHFLAASTLNRKVIDLTPLSPQAALIVRAGLDAAPCPWWHFQKLLTAALCSWEQSREQDVSARAEPHGTRLYAAVRHSAFVAAVCRLPEPACCELTPLCLG